MPTTQKIRYSDCDPQGIVFNGNFARYWDDALTDWFEEAGYDSTEMGAAGVEVVTARMEMDFVSSGGLGDVLETAIDVESIGTTSMTVLFTTRRLSDGEVVVRGREVLVFVERESFRPTPVPDEIRESLGGITG
ncbi:MAG: acyl-CoA thioesterase [Acidimicrobiia bacterium]